VLQFHSAAALQNVFAVDTNGADRLLQVRCAVYNGTLGSDFGQRFNAAKDLLPQMAAAA
jgi:hypothetical protein